ncbi:hypothetical protein GmRootV213_50090 (plasmid) [Variovorax sp. V213]
MAKPGGWVFFSTINRTPWAWLIAFFGAEPFGGIRGSSWGVEFGIDGLKFVTQPKIISIKKN